MRCRYALTVVQSMYAYLESHIGAHAGMSEKLSTIAIAAQADERSKVSFKSILAAAAAPSTMPILQVMTLLGLRHMSTSHFELYTVFAWRTSLRALTLDWPHATHLPRLPVMQHIHGA
jgi:hypothetical protein